MNLVIPYGRQDIDDADVDAVAKVVRGDFLTQGPTTEAFETSLKDYLGAKQVVSVSNGTAGLHLAFLSAGISKGDAVIVPAITFAATANAVLYCGATPVFADVDPETGNISVESINRCFKIAEKEGLKIKAIAPVHFAGRPCEMRQILEVAAPMKLMVVEDACHALGAEYRLSSDKPFQKVGSADFTSMAVFSFHPVKHITTGEGGAVSTADQKFAEKLKLLRSHGITKSESLFENGKLARDENGLINPWYQEMQDLGFNYRLCDIQAAIGCSQLRRLEHMVSRRRQIAKKYRESLDNISGLSLPPLDSLYSINSYHLFPLRIDFKKRNLSRAKFIMALREAGVGSQVHYLPVPMHPYYQRNRGRWLSDTWPAAENFYENELSVPMFSKMTDNDVDKVASTITRLLK
jgi:UDP-4-amino-4,6-dideoxy-N-acetyl-beta-L-altrosamine transaminase